MVILRVFAGTIGGLAIFLIHVIFTFTAYVDKGLTAAILTFLLAGISEVYWIVVKIGELGLFNSYTLFATIFFVLLIIRRAHKNKLKEQ